MSEAIVVALITGGLSLVGVIVTSLITARKSENTIKVAQAVTDTELRRYLWKPSKRTWPASSR